MSESSAARAAATRERLVAAAIRVLREEGAGALSSVRLAREAQIAQSGFYRYFPDVDACVAEAVTTLAMQLRADVAARRRAWQAGEAAEDLEAGVAHWRENLAFLLQHRDLAELALRRRYDAAGVGPALRVITDGMRADLHADFAAAIERAGARPDARAVDLAVSAVLGASWGMLEALLAGADLDGAARTLAVIGEAAYRSAMAGPAVTAGSRPAARRRVSRRPPRRR